MLWKVWTKTFQREAPPSSPLQGLRFKTEKIKKAVAESSTHRAEARRGAVPIANLSGDFFKKEASILCGESNDMTRLP